MSKAKLLFASVLGGAAVALSPLVVAAQNADQNAGQNADQSASKNAAGPQKLVDQSTNVVQRMQRDPNLRAVIAPA